MINKHDKARSEMKSHEDKTHAELAQRAAALGTQSLELLVKEAVGQSLKPVTAELILLRTQVNGFVAQQPDIVDQVNTRLMAFGKQLTEIKTRLQQIAYALERMEKRQEQFHAEVKLLENAGQERQLLTEEYYRKHVIQPMVRSLLPVFDFVNDSQNGKAGPNNNGELSIQKLADSVLAQLCQFLSAYEIELVQNKGGTEFDPHAMKPTQEVSTYDKRLNNRVAKSLRIGFKDRQQRLLRPESVALYKYCETQSTQQTMKRS